MPTPHPKLAQAIALIEAGRRPEGLLLLNQLAASNEAGALFTLAELKWCGGIVPQDLAQGRELYRRAGDAGHPGAAAAFTNLLASGVAGSCNWPVALRRLRDEGRGPVLALIKRMKLGPDGEPLALPTPQILSEAPDVRLFPELFSAEECDYLRETASPGFQPSIVVDVRTGREHADPIRTSDGSTFHWLIEDPAVHALNRRLAAASGTGVDQGEPLQILRYRPGQQYRRHSDFLPGVENKRILTALVYLNEGYEGGETCFVQTGLTVRGRKGDALVFRSSGPDGRADPMSEHAGMPVTRGVKYLASRWIRERRHVP